LSSNNTYNPWMDLNDDGVVDSTDLGLLGAYWGTTGTPMNKTALLLELQARIEALEAMVPSEGSFCISAPEFTPHSETETYSKWNEYLHG